MLKNELVWTYLISNKLRRFQICMCSPLISPLQDQFCSLAKYKSLQSTSA